MMSARYSLETVCTCKNVALDNQLAVRISETNVDCFFIHVPRVCFRYKTPRFSAISGTFLPLAGAQHQCIRDAAGALAV